MQLDPTIFRAYDIRGVVPDQITSAVAEQVGRAFAAHLKPKTAVVGRDVRLTGPEFHAAVLEGLIRMGVDVLDIGQVSTDAFYYTCASRNLPGIMVTASHNPAEYNGFKTVRRIPNLLLASEFKSYVTDHTYKDAPASGTVTQLDIIDEFLDYILKIVPVAKIKPLKVVVDTSNGAQGPIWQRLAKRLPITTVPLCFEPDGHFPNHGNDVIQPKNQALLRAAVKKEQADLGLIFDPDGDRCLLVDDRGETVPGDFVTALLAVSMLERKPGSAIVYDFRASDAVPTMVREAGGQPFEWKVGHAYIKPKMQELKAVFGGEVSGHYYFEDFWYVDCGLLAGLALLEYISSLPGKLSTKITQLEAHYNISGEINSTVPNVATVLERIRQHYGTNAKNQFGGVTVRRKSWHCVVRPSDNEPLVRLTLEADSPAEMAKRRDEVLGLIRQES
jgi:phosphomannomutase